MCGRWQQCHGTYYHYLNDERVQIISAEAGGLGIESGQTAATLHIGTVGIIHGFKTLLMQDDDGRSLNLIHFGRIRLSGRRSYTHILLKLAGRKFMPLQMKKLCKPHLNSQNWKVSFLPSNQHMHWLYFKRKNNFKAEDIVVLNVSGRGDKDMETYIQHATREPQPQPATRNP